MDPDKLQPAVDHDRAERRASAAAPGTNNWPDAETTNGRTGEAVTVVSPKAAGDRAIQHTGRTDKYAIEAESGEDRRKSAADLQALRSSAIQQAQTIGELEAEVLDLRLVVKEQIASRTSLQRELNEAREAVGQAKRTEQMTRMEVQRLLAFHDGVVRSIGWKFLQAVRGIIGRKW